MKVDRTASKSRLYWLICARQQLKQEHFMTPRNMRAYWGESKSKLDGPLGLFSSWQKYRRRRAELAACINMKQH